MNSGTPIWLLIGSLAFLMVMYGLPFGSHAMPKYVEPEYSTTSERVDMDLEILHYIKKQRLFALSDLPPKEYKFVEDTSAENATTPSSMSGYRLVGTVVTDERRIALLESRTEQMKQLVHVGNSIDGCVLKSLSAASASFLCGEMEERVYLPEHK